MVFLDLWNYLVCVISKYGVRLQKIFKTTEKNFIFFRKCKILTIFGFLSKIITTFDEYISLTYKTDLIMEQEPLPLIRIHGKSQSRTALGIVNAYLKIYPDATLLELQEAFPKSLNTKSFGDNIIVPAEKTKEHEKQFFEQEDELIVLKDGAKLALVELWQKDDFDAICEHAKQFGIEIAEFEKAASFEKGSYELEYLNDFVPPAEVVPEVEKKCWCKCKSKSKCKCKWWCWLLLLLLLLLILCFCLKKCGCCSDKCTKPAVETVETVAPEEEGNPLINDMEDAVSLTLPNGNECRIDKNSSEYKLFAFLNSDEMVNSDEENGWMPMDNLRFKTGKTELAVESENQLDNIASILKFFPNSRVKMGGYTDNTGPDNANMRISKERAKVAAEKLISFGIDAERVTHDGYGSKNPVCPANNTPDCMAQNRRIDVKVTQK